MPIAMPILKRLTGKVAIFSLCANASPTNPPKATTTAGLAPPNACNPDKSRVLRRTSPVKEVWVIVEVYIRKRKMLKTNSYYRFLLIIVSYYVRSIKDTVVFKAVYD